MVAGTSGGGFGGNQAHIQLQLKPVGVRKSYDGRGACAVAPQDGWRARRDDVPPERSGRTGRRTAGKRQYQYTIQAPDFAHWPKWGPKVLEQVLDIARDRRRQLRPADLGFVFERRHRPRYCVASRPDRASGRFGALRRVRPASGVGDVQVDQPISRGSGAAAAMVGKPGLPEYDLRSDPERHQRSSLDVHALHAGHHADLAAAPGTVPGQHDFVQPRRKASP